MYCNLALLPSVATNFAQPEEQVAKRRGRGQCPHLWSGRAARMLGSGQRKVEPFVAFTILSVSVVN